MVAFAAWPLDKVILDQICKMITDYKDVTLNRSDCSLKAIDSLTVKAEVLSYFSIELTFLITIDVLATLKFLFSFTVNVFHT